VGGTKIGYVEYVIKFMCSRFDWQWNFTQRFLEFYSFRALGSATMLTAITHQCIAYLPKLAPQIAVLGLLNALLSLTF